MGLLALKLLDNSGYFGLEAESETGGTTPLSCLTDGIQIGSGCTLGKGNIHVTNAKRPRARFTDNADRQVTIELRPSVYQGFLNGEIDEQSKLAQEKPLKELFLWEPPR